MSSLSATRSAMRTVLFCIISIFALKVSANCNNDKCLKALNSDLVQASSFCSIYTTHMAISTPSAINSGCKSSSSKILSACSCINTAVTTERTTTMSSTIAKSSSSSHTTSFSTSAPASRSTSTSISGFLPSTVTITLPPTTTTKTVSASATCTIGAPCSFYELAIAPCVLNFIQEDFGDFMPNCFGIGTGPRFVKSCICPYLSQLPAAFQAPNAVGVCATADITAGIAYQQAECQCLGATIG